MKFGTAIDDYIADMESQGRITSENTIRAYRECLNAHADDVGNRDPSKTGRDDIKRTLRRWTHPNSQRQKHAILTSFYDWAMEEGIRETNPARMARRARPRQVQVYRLTLDEVIALMDASLSNRREKWVIHLGVLAGLRRHELCELQGRHLARPGWVWVSQDIGKGHKERWMPVLDELAPIVEEILTLVGPQDHVIPTRRNRSLQGDVMVEEPTRGLSGEGMFKLVRRVGRRAGLVADIHPHTLRHAYGDHIARYAGLRAAQALMGHASSETTEMYTGRMTLDELAVSLHGFRYRRTITSDDTHERRYDPNAR